MFPYRGDRLNAITLHPELRRFAADNVGHDDIYCEQSHLHAKYRGSNEDQEQVHALRLRQPHARLSSQPSGILADGLPHLLHTGDGATRAHRGVFVAPLPGEGFAGRISYTREQRPEIFDNERRIIVPAGSLFIYSMRTFHRGTPFEAAGGRIAQFITYAPAAWKWLGIVGWFAQGVKPEFRRWMERATPAERELLAFPPPKHPYWTEETIAGVSARYPGMDMAPYRA